MENYRKRRAKENRSTDAYLKGRLVQPMPSIPGVVKAFKKTERKHAVASIMQKLRLERKGAKLQKKIKDLK